MAVYSSLSSANSFKCFSGWNGRVRSMSFVFRGGVFAAGDARPPAPAFLARGGVLAAAGDPRPPPSSSPAAAAASASRKVLTTRHSSVAGESLKKLYSSTSSNSRPFASRIVSVFAAESSAVSLSPRRACSVRTRMACVAPNSMWPLERPPAMSSSDSDSGSCASSSCGLGPGSAPRSGGSLSSVSGKYAYSRSVTHEARLRMPLCDRQLYSSLMKSGFCTRRAGSIFDWRARPSPSPPNFFRCHAA